MEWVSKFKNKCADYHDDSKKPSRIQFSGILVVCVYNKNSRNINSFIKMWDNNRENSLRTRIFCYQGRLLSDFSGHTTMQLGTDEQQEIVQINKIILQYIC